MRLAVRAIVVGLLAASALVGFSAAFALAAGADLGPAQSTTTSTTTTTTEPPGTTVPPPVPSPPPTPPRPPRQIGIPGGVAIAGVDVGGLLPYQAADLVRRSFARPIVLVISPTQKMRVAPEALGAKPAVKKAVSRARFSRPGASVPLHVWVSRDRIRGYVESLGRELDRAPVSSRLVLRGATVQATRSVDGRRLERVDGARAIRVALKTNARPPLRLSFAVLKPTVAADKLGPAVVILRGSNKLRLFEGAKLVRTFGVATGLAKYPTPTGNFEIVTMQRNPWWYPPPSDWAEDADPVPPGPGNPLGTRWMGISAPYVGIHGTPDAASIGYSASHGCVRMRISDAEWLFQHVEVGTPVFIVST
ncbi:MAG: L,D-transpeptidase/peptidoglycan binding protein [Actinomycetota bacterium]|nr:L,D-transpeptidase/peptidoglycan binding protein [Actinomycetota bacterium]